LAYFSKENKMKKILLFAFFALLASFTDAQTFTFECYCGDLSGVRCDICTGQTQTRFFCGLLVKKSGTVVKWIDAPYIIQWQGKNAIIKEIIPNPESITINLSGTSFANIAAFKAALECPCNVPGKLFYISDSTKFKKILRGDTMTIVGRNGATVVLDTSNRKFIVTAAAGAAQVLSATGAGPTRYNIVLSGGGGAVVLKEGASIDLTRSTDTITIANTAPDQTVVINGAGINVVTGTYPNFTVTGTEVDGNTANEGLLGVGAGTSTSSVLLSNTTGAAGVTINAAGINAITETTSANGGQITITATEVDGSTTNELQTLSVASNTATLSNSGGSVTIAGAGINTVSTSGSTITVTGTEVDGSVSNELQTIANTSDSTSHTATLSNSGGSIKFVEGSNITLTTTGTGLAGIVTIATTGLGNGIYGGSGSLPTGGSVVTTGGYPLSFNTNTSSGTSRTILNLSTPYSADDAFTYWLRGKSPNDTLLIYNYNQEGYITNEKNLYLKSNDILTVSGDSIVAIAVPAITKMPAVMGITAGGTFKKIVGTSNGQALVWNSGGWAPGTASSGGITGTLTSGRVTLSSGTSTVTDDADLLYNSTNNQMQIGAGTAVGFYNILQGPIAGNSDMYYSSANVSGDMISQQLNANNANAASNSIQRLQTGGASGGDPYTQYKIGASTTTYSVGLDNSDVDKYKITPSGTAPGSVANKSLVVTNDATPRVGVDIDAPTCELDVAGKTRSQIVYTTNNNPTAVYSTGAGTGVTGSTLTGGANGFYWTFTTGSGPASGGDIATITLPFSFPAKAIGVLMQANDNAANNFIRFKYSFASSGTNTLVFNANGALPASTAFAFSVLVWGY
jgi:hypothetical protein